VKSENKNAESRNLGLTQDDRRTVENALDPRTMRVLSKFYKRNLFDEIFGCISTGKEANVYYATTPNGEERAVKVYKTSALVFKDRAKYVEGEYRFRSGYCHGNPRKMVAQWADKELRNLKRLKAVGVVCPEAIDVRQNVLIMEFIGESGVAAKRLKDVEDLEPADWRGLYISCVQIMRRMMHGCRLVHGDLSEFNMLYHKDSITIIDVSQSVQIDHPHALEYLKRDCINVRNFFAKNMNCAPLPVRQVFEFVVGKTLPSVNGRSFQEQEDIACIDALLKEVPQVENETAQDQSGDALFLATWIPTHLDQVIDRAFIEGELERRARGEKPVCSRLLADEPVPSHGESSDDCAGEDAEVDSASNSDKESGDGADENSDTQETPGKEHRDGHKPGDMDKKEWKKKVKEQQSEKRKENKKKELAKKGKLNKSIKQKENKAKHTKGTQKETEEGLLLQSLTPGSTETT